MAFATAQFERAVSKAVSTWPVVEIDLSGTTALNAGAVDVLIEARTTAQRRGAIVTVSAASPTARHALTTHAALALEPSISTLPEEADDHS